MEQSPNSLAPLGLVVVSANLMVTLLLTVSMLIDRNGATFSAIGGVLYFALTTPFFLVCLTGQLPGILSSWMREVTERRKNKLQAELLRLHMSEEVEIPPFLQPIAHASNYIPAVDDGTRSEAIAYARRLFTPDGFPDSDLVWPDGRLRRKGPSHSARDYLLSRRVLKRVQNGLALDATTLSTALQNL